MPVEFKDYHKVIGVTRTASDAEIQTVRRIERLRTEFRHVRNQ